MENMPPAEDPKERPIPTPALVTPTSRRKCSTTLRGRSAKLLTSGYNGGVIDLVVRLVAKVVVPLFFLGMAGSVVVIVVSFIEDLRELLGDEE